MTFKYDRTPQNSVNFYPFMQNPASNVFTPTGATNKGPEPDYAARHAAEQQMPDPRGPQVRGRVGGPGDAFGNALLNVGSMAAQGLGTLLAGPAGGAAFGTAFNTASKWIDNASRYQTNDFSDDLAAAGKDFFQQATQAYAQQGSKAFKGVTLTPPKKQMSGGFAIPGDITKSPKWANPPPLPKTPTYNYPKSTPMEHLQGIKPGDIEKEELRLFNNESTTGKAAYMMSPYKQNKIQNQATKNIFEKIRDMKDPDFTTEMSADERAQWKATRKELKLGKYSPPKVMDIDWDKSPILPEKDLSFAYKGGRIIPKKRNRKPDTFSNMATSTSAMSPKELGRHMKKVGLQKKAELFQNAADNIPWEMVESNFGKEDHGLMKAKTFYNLMGGKIRDTPGDYYRAKLAWKDAGIDADFDERQFKGLVRKWNTNA